MPNTPPVVSPKKNSGGFLFVILIVGGICLWGWNNIKKADEKRALEKQRESERSARVVELAQERKIKLESPVAAEFFPKRVEEVAKEQFGGFFRSATAKYNGGKNGWEVAITAMSAWNNRSAIEQQMKEIAGGCFLIKGQSITRFKITFLSKMTDGLGNITEEPLVACHLIESTIPKIKWGNGNTDTWILDFAKIFEIDFIAKSFASEWVLTN